MIQYVSCIFTWLAEDCMSKCIHVYIHVRVDGTFYLIQYEQFFFLKPIASGFFFFWTFLSISQSWMVQEKKVSLRFLFYEAC